MMKSISVHTDTVFSLVTSIDHDDVIKWNHCPNYWPFVRGIHWSLVDFPKASDTELWCFFFICAWTNVWTNNRDAGDLRRHSAHYDVTVINPGSFQSTFHGGIQDDKTQRKCLIVNAAALSFKSWEFHLTKCWFFKSQLYCLGIHVNT